MNDETPKMDPLVKAEWIQRLRSGKYKQGRTYLRREGRYCCLGVLGAYAAEQGVIKWTSSADYLGTWTVPADHLGTWAVSEESPDDVWALSGSGKMFSCMLPPKVSDWAGLPLEVSIDNPIAIGLDEKALREGKTYLQDMLVQRNDLSDEGHWTFEQIADWIEENL